MSNLKKIRILTWTVILLLIINMAAMGTMFYHAFIHNSDSIGKGRGIGGNFIEKELKMTTLQCNQFRRLRKDFFNRTNSYSGKQHSLREKMVQELSKNNPDSNILNNIADSMGEMQKIMKRETFRHFMKLKMICTPDQKEKLNKLFKEIPQLTSPGKGGEMQNHYRHGRENQELQHQN